MAILNTNMHMHTNHTHTSPDTNESDQGTTTDIPHEDKSDNGTTIDDGGEDSFWYPPEEEPKLTPNVQERAKRAVEHAVELVESNDDTTESTPSHAEKCCNSCTKCCEFDLFTSKSSGTLNLSSEAKVASNQGSKMLRKFLNPALPKFLADIWVLAELAITLTQFILSVTAISLSGGNQGFNYTYLALASVGLLLASVDAFVYFVQLGSCARIFRYARRKVLKKKKDKVENRKGCCQFLSDKTQQRIKESFDVVRNILSELLVYPLVILDLFDLIVGGSLLRRDSSERISFGLFIIGALFLLLSVYFMRAFMVVIATVNLKRLPTSQSSSSHQGVISTVIKFCIHVLAQMIVHICIIIAVALKISQENPNPADVTAINASPFLLYAVIVGGIIPLYGVGVFFIVNYYQLHELSIGVWVDMLSLLQSESFAEVAFQGKGLKLAIEKAKSFVEKMKVSKVKEELKDIQSVSFWVKVFYPFRIPVFVIIGLVYELLLVSFVISLMFNYDSTNGIITLALFDGGLSTGFFVLLIFIALANAHVLLLVSAWIAVLVVLIILFPFFILAYAALYVVETGILLCGACFYPFAKEFDLFERPIAHINELRRRTTLRH